MESVPYLWRSYLRHRRLVPLRRQGHRLGLLPDPSSSRLSGAWGLRPIEVRIHNPLRRPARMTIRMRAPELAQTPSFRLLAHDLTVEGSRLAAAAALDTELKAALQPEDRLGLRGDTLEADLRASDLTPWLRSLERSVRALLEPTRLPERVAKRMEEPDSRLRRFALQALVREAPDAPATRQALERARSDPQAWVRLEAHLLDADQEGIYGIAIDPESPMELVDEGLRALDRGGRSEALVHVLAQRHRNAVARRTALAAAVEPGPISPAALEAALRDLDREVRLRAVRAHGDLEDGEPRLLELLEGRHPCLAGLDYFERVKLSAAAAEALGRVGTERCMGPLRRQCEGAGLLAPLAEPTRKALAQLEQRYAPADVGRLSLAPVPRGAVSLAVRGREEP